MAGLKAIGKVVRMRETADKTTTKTAYYLLSEDQDRTRMGHGPHNNLAVLRHKGPQRHAKRGSKGSLRGKFQRAGWDDGFLYRLLELDSREMPKQCPKQGIIITLI